MPVDDGKSTEPTFRVVTPRGLRAMGTKLYAFGEEVPGVLGIEMRMEVSVVDGIQTSLIIKMMGTPVVVEVADAPPPA